MKKIILISVSVMLMAGCSTTTSKLFGEDVPNTPEVITTPLESAVIVESVIPTTE